MHLIVLACAACGFWMGKKQTETLPPGCPFVFNTLKTGGRNPTAGIALGQVLTRGRLHGSGNHLAHKLLLTFTAPDSVRDAVLGCQQMCWSECGW